MARVRENPVFLTALGLAGLLISSRPAAKPHESGKQDVGQAASRQPAVSAPPAPAPGLWPLLKRTASAVNDNMLMTQAAAVTFYALLSIFPALAAMVAIYGLIANPATIVAQMNQLSAILPGGGADLLNDELHRLTAASNSGLTWALVIGIGTSIWTSNQATKAIFAALNAAHEVKETRSFFKLTAMSLAVTASAIVFCLLAIAAVVIVPAVLGAVGLGFIGTLVNWLRWPLLLVGVAALIAVLFRFGPCRSRAVWRWISWGSGFAAVAWLLVSVLFSWYVGNFGSYNKTYGALGAVIGFMTWIWISGTVVLAGAQLDAELEKSTQGKQPTRASAVQAPVVQAG